MTQTDLIETNQNWKPKLLIVGTVVGSLIGLGASYLLARSAEERGGGPPQVTTGDALKLGVAAIGLVRGIASLGD